MSVIACVTCAYVLPMVVPRIEVSSAMSSEWECMWTQPSKVCVGRKRGNPGSFAEVVPGIPADASSASSAVTQSAVQPAFLANRCTVWEKLACS